MGGIMTETNVAMITTPSADTPSSSSSLAGGDNQTPITSSGGLNAGSDHPSDYGGSAGGGSGGNESDFDMDMMNASMLAKGGAGQQMKILPEEFVPGEHDVICGRGRRIFMHAGNVRFRRMVEDCLEEYSSTVTKMEKTFILGDIIAQVRMNSPNGGFVKKEAKDGRWYEVGDYLAREKTSQAFRDALFDQYKSSNTAKKLRKRGEKMKIMPRRAFSSTSLLEGTKIGADASGMMMGGGMMDGGMGGGVGGYSDPLIAKLRMHKSAGGASTNPVVRSSCPNLSAPGGYGGGAPSRNFDWGASAGGGAGGAAGLALMNAFGGGGDGSKNFVWSQGGMKSGGGDRKMNFSQLSSFLNGRNPNAMNSMAPPPPQAPQGLSSAGNGQMQFDALELYANAAMQNSNGALSLATSETEPESTSTAQSGYDGNGDPNLLGIQLMLGTSPGATGAMGFGRLKQPPSSTRDMGARLQQLRDTTFNATGITDPLMGIMGSSSQMQQHQPQLQQLNQQQARSVNDPLQGLLASMSGEDAAQMMNSMSQLLNDTSEIDVFDKLVGLVGGVEEDGDPFEPDPLP